MQDLLRLYVAYHDSRPHPLLGQAPYVAVCNVGPHGRPTGFDVYDDEGGFPEKNSAYCELSALRHLELHGDAQYLGLAHYRRLFLTRRMRKTLGPYTYDVPSWDWSQVDRYGAGEAALMAAVDGADWCTAPLQDVRWSGHPHLWDQFSHHHPERLLVEMCAALQTVHPESPDLHDYLHRATTLAPFNMFIARADLVRRYCSWLWPVLTETDRRLGVIADAYQQRYPGFLAERLQSFWLSFARPESPIRQCALPIAVVRPGGRSASSRALVRGPGTSVPVGPQGWFADVVRLVPFKVRAATTRTGYWVASRPRPMRQA